MVPGCTWPSRIQGEALVRSKETTINLTCEKRENGPLVTREGNDFSYYEMAEKGEGKHFLKEKKFLA